jgi:hypothetical protein
VAEAVVIGELSLMSALVTGQLVKSHMKYNRSFNDILSISSPSGKSVGESSYEEHWNILHSFSLHSKNLHMFSFLFDDFGDVFGVHTFTLAKARRKTYEKFC